ncbi:bacterial Ig-like domain-containing protein [Alkalihalobacillus trypoxylicola]|uniref:bacterial Ig-like domain-containing protein n=3 Tax=Alkalihalobacillus trypoxylicola TaxID=519424 RepID=UPI0007DC2A50|nr:bacterial Ig-like domain-containing protein [Alkalihalobacillus trypoxylicola]
MNNRKKVLHLFFCFLIVFSTFPGSVLANDTTTTGEGDMISISSDWKGSVFGDVGGQANITAENFLIQENDSSVVMKALNNRGKMASSTEGIAYYYQELPESRDFSISATVTVNQWTANNQVSFGIMLRENILENQSEGSFTGDYLAVGALDQQLKGFKKQDGVQEKNGYEFTASAPNEGEIYELTLEKEGSLYRLSVNDEVKWVDQYTGELHYGGFFAARNTEIEIQNIQYIISDPPEISVQELLIDPTSMKRDYLVGEELDLSELKVTAVYEDGSTEDLENGQYRVTGFSNDMIGDQTLTVHYSGVTATFTVSVNEPEVTELSIRYLPAITQYIIGDRFDASGLRVSASFNNGDQRMLENEEFTIWHDEQLVDQNYRFSDVGEVTFTIKAESEIITAFSVQVEDLEIKELEVRRLPEKQTYFIGDELDLSGLILYAVYENGQTVRLTAQDYEVTSLDTSEAGEKNIEIDFKGEKQFIPIIVKEKERIGLEITKYPQTTYQIGENFERENLEVSYLYDNGDREVIPSDDWSIDLSNYDFEKPGVYPIFIRDHQEVFPAVELNVTVREEVELDWKSIRFGQSISASRNFHEVVTDDVIKLTALEGGGKVTGDHDGITFYYVELDALNDNFELSANIKVEEYAKTPHDGQESFGIMARDIIGTELDSSVLASNIAAIGGFSGGSRNENGTQLFARTGVLSPDGEGSAGIQSKMVKNEKPSIENTHPNENYRLTLSKNNSGFVGALNGDNEQILYTPEILTSQNEEKMYIGFYTARLATIEVSDIELNITDAQTDPPKVEPPREPVTPEIEVVSLNQTSDEEYVLRVQSNVNGVLTVKQNEQFLDEEFELTENEVLNITTTIAANDFTDFSLNFLPDDTELLTSYNRIVENFTVEMRMYQESSDIFVAPDGTSAGVGTREQPLDLDTAISFVKAGQKIIVTEGDYIRNQPLNIKKYNDGNEEALKYLVADEGTRPVIDFNQQTEGVILSGNYWHVKGLDFARSAPNTKGFTVGGSYNIVERSRFYEHGDTGLQISRTDGSPNFEDWPSHNLILNSDSFFNRDPSENNADGFAAKLTSGEGNIFRGCIAHNNIDDGWDLYTKLGTGAIGAVIIEDSIAYHNGYLKDGSAGAGDKNGFKLGGEGIHVEHIIRNSMAFGNGAYGFTSNSNPGVRAENNIAFDNAGGNFAFTTYRHIETDFKLHDMVSYQIQHDVRDQYPESNEATNNYFFNGQDSQNINGITLNDSNFKSLEEVVPYERDENGDIIWGEFLAFISPDLEDDDTGSGDGDSGSGDGDSGSGDGDSGSGDGDSGSGDGDSGSGDGDSGSGDGDSGSDEKVEDSKKEQSKKDHDYLPQTNAGYYQWLLNGAILILLASFIFILLRRRTQKNQS